MNIILNFLKGKKTYIAGISGVIYGLCMQDYQIVLTSLAIMGLRGAISTTSS